MFSSKPIWPNTRIKPSVGFTLIEMLLSVAIMLIVFTFILAILTTTLSGSLKSRLVSELRQNGDFALELMSVVVKNAKRVSGGSCLGVISSPYPQISLELIDDTTAVFACPISPSTINFNGNPLISHKVKLTSCNFSCENGFGQRPDVILVQFTLEQEQLQKVGSTSNQTFSSTVMLRNY